MPNKTLLDVSDPVKTTPSQPSKVPKTGYSRGPARVNARPSTASMPEYLVTNPRAIMQKIAAIAGTSRTAVRPKILACRAGPTPRTNPLNRAAANTAVAVEEIGTTSTIAFS